MNRKLVLFISMSLDGFIATKDDDLSWLQTVAAEGEDYGYAAMMERSDTYLVGRRTYEIVKEMCGGEFPQAKTHTCYILSRENRTEEGVHFYAGDPETLIRELKSKPGKDIYCDGGSQVVKALMAKNLIDEYIISVIPITLGDGIRLFAGGIGQIPLKLVEAKSYASGLVQLRYARN
jgi:dihydrofolate reductase